MFLFLISIVYIDLVLIGFNLGIGLYLKDCIYKFVIFN